jgi:zinc D-Ala-D-Ala dipeptidase
MSNKITKGFYIPRYILFIFSVLIYKGLYAQDTALPVIKTYKQYKLQAIADSSKKMVELKSVVPGIVYDLRYTTTNNFTGQKLYRPTPFTFMRQPAAAALSKVQKELNEKGLGLKIFDAYRPYAATVKMWDLIRDERYVADPKKGSGHNRGLAVDLTIINLEDGKELNMGTGFDNFTDTAHHAFAGLPEAILQNRLLLKNTMEKYGFTLFETEWWHYYWPNDRKYDVMDIEFGDLQKEKNKF